MYDRLVDILVERFEVRSDAITPETTFEQLEMDSLFLVELMLVVQSELGVELDDDSASPKDTVGHAAALIEEKATAAAS
jgi:acyl carrier protein